MTIILASMHMAVRILTIAIVDREITLMKVVGELKLSASSKVWTRNTLVKHKVTRELLLLRMERVKQTIFYTNVL